MSRNRSQPSYSVKIPGGASCPKCGKAMQRLEHAQIWCPAPGQSFYFKWWDQCVGCKHTQLYNDAKVPLS